MRMDYGNFLPETLTLEQTIEMIENHDCDSREFFEEYGIGHNDFPTKDVMGWLGY
jgi:hypothetical protein